MCVCVCKLSLRQLCGQLCCVVVIDFVVGIENYAHTRLFTSSTGHSYRAIELGTDTQICVCVCNSDKKNQREAERTLWK